MTDRAKFIADNLDLIAAGAPLVNVVERGSSLSVVLELGDSTTQRDIRRAIPIAAQLRDRLVEAQGLTHGFDPGDWTMQFLVFCWKSGAMSWPAITKWVNDAIEKSRSGDGLVADALVDALGKKGGPVYSKYAVQKAVKRWHRRHKRGPKRGTK